MGRGNPFYGKHHTEETKGELSKLAKEKYIGENNPMYGKRHSKEAIRKMSEIKRGKILSRETREKMSLAKRGEKAWNWKGGISTENEIIRGSVKYKEWIKRVFMRDGYMCVCCLGKNSSHLNAHHIIPFSIAIEKRFELDNGVTLCEDCHKQIHKRSIN